LSPLNCPYSNSIIEIMNIASNPSGKVFTPPANRIMDRILIDDNLENMACCCDDWADFVIQITEWGIDHLGGVDFDTLTTSDIEKLDEFIFNQ